MVLSMWQMYLITRLEPLHHFFAGLITFIAVLSLVGFIICIIYFSLYFSWNELKEIKENFFKVAKIVFFVTAFLSMVLIFLPTKQDMAMIYIVPAVVNNENVQQLPNDMVELAKQGIEKLLDNPIETAKKAVE